MTLFHGSNFIGVYIVVLFFIFQFFLYSYKIELVLSIKKSQKEYELVEEDLELQNMQVLEGIEK